MSISKARGLIAALMWSGAGFAMAQQSALRITCEGDAAGAEVSVNGSFKGECPLDVKVNPGTVTVNVVQKKDANYTRVFDTEFRIGSDVAKRVMVELSEPVLTPEGRRREQERRDEDAARERRAADAAAKQLAVAVEREATQKKFEEFALFDTLDRFKTSSAYRTMEARYRDDIVALLSAPLTDLRMLSLDATATTRFVEQDPFFAVSGSGETVRKSYPTTKSSVTAEKSCTGHARTGTLWDFSRVKNTFSPDGVSDTTYNTLLGGLVNTGFHTRGQDRLDYTLEIIAVQGQAFPLMLGKRFGIHYTRKPTKSEFKALNRTILLTCAAVRSEPNGTGGNDIELACLEQITHGIGSDSSSFIFANHKFNTSQGCTLPMMYQIFNW